MTPNVGLVAGILGALAGASIGMLLGVNTFSDPQTSKLLRRYQGDLEQGWIVVAVAELDPRADTPPLDQAQQLLNEIRNAA